MNLLGYMAGNVLSGECDVVDPGQIDSLVALGWTLLDVRARGEHLQERSPDRSTCPSTCSGNTSTCWEKVPSSSIARWVNGAIRPPPSCTSSGFEARNLDGGYQTWSAIVRARREPVVQAGRDSTGPTHLASGDGLAIPQGRRRRSPERPGVMSGLS